MATINNGRETLHDSVLYTSGTENGDHVFESTFQIPAHANCLKITVSLSINVYSFTADLFAFTYLFSIRVLMCLSIIYILINFYGFSIFFASSIQLTLIIPVGLIPVSACPRPHSTPLPAHLSSLPPTVQHS